MVARRAGSNKSVNEISFSKVKKDDWIYVISSYPRSIFGNVYYFGKVTIKTDELLGLCVDNTNSVIYRKQEILINISRDVYYSFYLVDYKEVIVI